MTAERTRIKICGITTRAAAQAAVDAGADAIGFVFAEGSPRYIDPVEAYGILATLPPLVATVGVFRDASLERFIRIEQQCPTDWSQLHGDEDEQMVQDCGPRVVRGIRFNAATIADDLRRWDAVEEVEAILVDGSAGGEGHAFDWTKLADAAAGVATPLIVAGGLDETNVGEAIRACRPYAVDVSSGVERAPGVKDDGKISEFCLAVRRADAAR